MLYYALNVEKYNGRNEDIAEIRNTFLREISSKASNVKSFHASGMDCPPFNVMPWLEKEEWFLLDSIDDESVDYKKEIIISLIEESHSSKLPRYNKSLTEMGLHYDFVLYIPNKAEDVIWQDYFAENNFEISNESVGDENLSFSEKVTLLSDELLKIGSAGSELTIIDPYIFPEKHDTDYLELFIKILETSKVKKLKIITGSNLPKYKEKLYKEFSQKISIPVTIYRNEKLHDRYWIIEDKKQGIFIGCSLNGIGKRISLISPISKEDIEKLIDKIVKKSKK